MAGGCTKSNKGKQPIINLSSDEEPDPEPQSESQSESESESDSEFEEGSESDFEEEPESDSEEERNEEEPDSDYVNDGLKGKVTDEESCRKVINLLQGDKNLNELKLEECKAYLRIHGLRISGAKATCIKRILEHWRIKDGNGERLYPKSSFVINCTGDVCRGDIVLFRQKVYENFDIVKRGRGGRVIGERIIAGRVVKESYGRSKQQHTFSIEVLWNKGIKPLPPLYSVLVKGRNLYRLKTFRQPWTNEAERSRVLAEKHSRGAVARHVRANAKSTTAKRGSKRKNKPFTSEAPANKKRRKEMELVSGKHKKKQNCCKPLSHDNKSKKKAAKTNLGYTRKTHAKVEEVANAGYLQTNNYQHLNDNIQREHPYTHRRPYINYNHTPAEYLQRIHHLPINISYNSAMVGGPLDHLPRSHNTDSSSFMQNGSHNGRSIENYACSLDPRRHFLFERTEASQLQGWRRY